MNEYEKNEFKRWIKEVGGNKEYRKKSNINIITYIIIIVISIYFIIKEKNNEIYLIGIGMSSVIFWGIVLERIKAEKIMKYEKIENHITTLKKAKGQWD